MPWLPWLLSMYIIGNVHIFFYNIHFSPKSSKYFYNFVTVLNKCFFLKHTIQSIPEFEPSLEICKCFMVS